MSDFTMYAGDTRIMEVVVVDDDGEIVDITGNDLFWELSRVIGASPALSKTIGDGITVTDAVQGEFEIKLEGEDTDPFYGDYAHEIKMVDVSGNVSTVLQGTITFSSVQIDIEP